MQHHLFLIRSLEAITLLALFSGPSTLPPHPHLSIPNPQRFIFILMFLDLFSPELIPSFQGRGGMKHEKFTPGFYLMGFGSWQASLFFWLKEKRKESERVTVCFKWVSVRTLGNCTNKYDPGIAPSKEKSSQIQKNNTNCDPHSVFSTILFSFSVTDAPDFSFTRR